MSHAFNVGDAIEMVSTGFGWSAEVGDTGKIKAFYSLVDGEPAYIVELDKLPGSRIAYKERRLALQQDDLLPPVPDSVMYNAGQGCRLEVATLPPNANYEARVRIGVFSNTLVYQGKCTCLEPDEVLQLAHDLRRMAMQIKRNQKQEQAQ